MEQYRDSQYDDDLTVGMDEKEDLFDTGFVDLFEYSGDDESPIARLKTIVLSIDWEINDQVLTQFNEELIDLKDIWGGDAIKLVYIQALEKIGKYIYQQKSDAHPNAIKLLLSFYYNLEKIVLNEDLTEEEKKEILREDVRKFDQLKQQIGRTPQTLTGSGKKSVTVDEEPATINELGGSPPVLFNLKACILGMDWEITERELSDLSREIKTLEDEFAGSKPKMLFLQGIGALGGYIKLKKSNAHADAFKLLYSFYEGLENVVVNELSLEEEKKILLPQVEKFEAFKKTIASTISPGTTSEEPDQGDDTDYDDSIAPAFADVPEDTKGFQAEDERDTLGEGDSQDMEGRLDSFFTDETDKGSEPEKPVVLASETLPKEAQERIDSFFSEENDAEELAVSVSTEDALRGVDVETEADDDSDEDALPIQGDGALAPALAESEDKEEHGFNPDLSAIEKEGVRKDVGVSEVEESVGDFLKESGDEPFDDESHAALAGVNVETEADDDSGEAPLPKIDDEIAPALFGGEDEEEVFAETEANTAINDQIAGFFDDEETPHAETVESGEQTPEDIESRLDSFFDESPLESELQPEPDHIEEEVTTDLENEIDSFFGEEDSGENLFRAAPEEEPTVSSMDADVEPESHELATEIEGDDSAVYSPGEDAEDEFTIELDDEKDEEITFEPADEEDEETEGELPVAILEGEESIVDDDLSSFGSGSDEKDFFAAIDERVDEPGEFQMEILDETDELEDSAVTVEPEVESASEEVEEVEIPDEEEEETEEEEEPFTFSSDDNLAKLREGIASLGVEINESIVDGILVEINGLRHQMSTRPIEKTFLQLISTIVQHIGQYGYEASAEAHGLLLSVFDKLELIQNAEIKVDQAQEVLLAETCKVLLWQQKMLDRQAVRKGDQLTFIDPVRTDEKVSDDEAEDRLSLDDMADDEKLSDVVVAEEEEFSAVFEPVEEDEIETLLEAGDEEPLEEDETEPQLEAGGEDIELLTEDSLEEDLDFASVTDESEFQEDDLFKELDDDEEEMTLSEEDDLSDDHLTDDEGIAVQDEETYGDELLLAGDESEIDTSAVPVEHDPVIANFVKQEIEALRQSLKQEIEELKRQLKDK